ncbi:MAG: hypothetical protein AAFN91_12800 [Pseudomonadota bacterium]
MKIKNETNTMPHEKQHSPKVKVLTGGEILEVPKSDLSPIQSSITCGGGLPDPMECDPFGNC